MDATKVKHSVTITIDTINGGSQLVAYGPHVTEANITVTIPEEPSVWGVYYLDQPYAERLIKALVSRYCDDEGEHALGGMNDYFSPHLKVLERIEFEERRRAVWHVRIETPFTD